ncbi:hypothetical protein BJV82DRAFT_608425 [Fennellomyces sp. T-0311]|nr:hypothetical protein BJV82DRAFT_608425 [Fennellomyces sp. T-0311]
MTNITILKSVFRRKFQCHRCDSLFFRKLITEHQHIGDCIAKSGLVKKAKTVKNRHQKKRRKLEEAYSYETNTSAENDKSTRDG